jgi:type IV pilus assembly protein PilW
MNPTRSVAKSTGSRRNASQGGFSLIELMVALTLGLIIIGGVLSIFATNQQAFKTNDALGRLQENARISFELMAREVRQAGGNLCGTPLLVNVLKTTDWTTNWDNGALIGVDSTATSTIVATGTATAERVAGTDAIQVLGSGLGYSAGIVSHNPVTNVFTLNQATPAIAANSLVMVCDGDSAVIAQSSTAPTTTTIGFNTAGTSPGNCTTDLGPTTTCATPVPKTFKSDGFVAPLNASFWYVGYNGQGGKSLYRRRFSTSEEIAEGVTNMEIRYVRRNEASGVMDSDWLAASAITNWTPATSDHVVAVRFKLTLETAAKLGTNQQPLQRTLIYVVNLRNRVD